MSSAEQPTNKDKCMRGCQSAATKVLEVIDKDVIYLKNHMGHS